MGDVDIVKAAAGFGAVVAAVVAVWRGAAFVLRMRDYLMEMDRQMKIMWGAQVRRGQVEAERSGVIITTPGALPDVLDSRVRDRFFPLRDDLRASYRAAWTQLPFNSLLLEIEAKFGQRIVEAVCRPLGLTQGACWHAAAIICQETDSIQAS